MKTSFLTYAKERKPSFNGCFPPQVHHMPFPLSVSFSLCGVCRVRRKSSLTRHILVSSTRIPTNDRFVQNSLPLTLLLPKRTRGTSRTQTNQPFLAGGGDGGAFPLSTRANIGEGESLLTILRNDEPVCQRPWMDLPLTQVSETTPFPCVRSSARTPFDILTFHFHVSSIPPG